MMMAQEPGLVQPGRNQVRVGDDADPEEHLVPGGGDGPATVRGGDERHRLDEGAGVPRQPDDPVRVPERRAYVRLHDPARQAPDAGGEGRPRHLRRLHPLVPAGAAGHLERVLVRQAHLPLVETDDMIVSFLKGSRSRFFSHLLRCLVSPHRLHLLVLGSS